MGHAVELFIWGLALLRCPGKGRGRLCRVVGSSRFVVHCMFCARAQAYTARKGLARRGTEAEADEKEETRLVL